MHRILTILIAIVWLVNGLFCKVLNFVPRHEQIVAAIVGHEGSRTVTLLIGIAEVLMAVWVLSRYQSRLNAVIQMAVVAAMNILEFLMVPELLLWGRFNILFAGFFVFLVYYYEFILSGKPKPQKET